LHRPVGSGDHRIVDARVGEPDLPADDVVEHRLALVGNPQSDGAGRLLLAAESPVETVTLLVRTDVLGGRGRVVGVAGLEQLAKHLTVPFGSLGLEHRALVPVEVQPTQRIEDLLDVLRGGAFAIGIFDAQHERPRLARRAVLLAAGEQPVVERRPGTADVQCAGRGRGEANAHDLERSSR